MGRDIGHRLQIAEGYLDTEPPELQQAVIRDPRYMRYLRLNRLVEEHFEFGDSLARRRASRRITTKIIWKSATPAVSSLAE